MKIEKFGRLPGLVRALRREPAGVRKRGDKKDEDGGVGVEKEVLPG